jgi:hypothetical protein
LQGSVLLVIPRSAATRNLLEFCTASRRIPNCGFLTSVRNDTGKGAFRGAQRPPVIPRSAATRNLLEFCTASRRRFVRAGFRPPPPAASKSSKSSMPKAFLRLQVIQIIHAEGIPPPPNHPLSICVSARDILVAAIRISALLLSYCHKKQENLFAPLRLCASASLRLCARHFGCGHPH